MSDFRQITDDFWASPQISLVDVDEAAIRWNSTSSRRWAVRLAWPAGVAVEKAAK